MSNNLTKNLEIVLKGGSKAFNMILMNDRKKLGGQLGVDEFLTSEDLAHRIMSLKTTNEKVNFLKQINDVNDKTYDQAVLGLYDMYPNEADEIITKAVKKIEGGRRPKNKRK